ncbi:LANO_0H16182g1_1 [Lachancea nothofagi CBS 11611]|uniref:LANO_0H16182g1_1 n=1 Tax=Lachancea nothofagi CBS 11611 TaxID=1266666 RepID=A0A1G4KMU7_9SACH|nr:LANO_0H16182g1_1 [Lachancea nothofagi CBS 11611]
MKPNDIEFELSELFEIRTTKYGGRACFARRDIPVDTDVLVLHRALGSIVCHEFRKEVCCVCFLYDNGRTMKVRLMEKCPKLAPKGAGLWFCSEKCRHDFLSRDRIESLIEAYELFETNWLSRASDRAGLEDCQTADPEHQISKTDIQRMWDGLEHSWVPMIDRMKLIRQRSQLPVLNEDEYGCVRFVAHCLFTLATANKSCVQMQAFRSLQSNELVKIQQYPILLKVQENVFKTLYVLLPPQLKPMLTSAIFRHILGSEYGNSFGIWESAECSESREYLGYCVLPEASYFNHSCAPNLAKRRQGERMIFTLNSPAQKDQELCIDYKGILGLPVKERRCILQENWFFDCGCERCLREMVEG